MPDVLTFLLIFWLEFYALEKCRFLEGYFFKSSQLFLFWWKLSSRLFPEGFWRRHF